MKRVLPVLIFLLFVTSCASLQVSKKDEPEFLKEDIDFIAMAVENQVPYKSSVLILDFEDLDGVITHFGRYVADKLYIRLSIQETNITYIERQNIEFVWYS